MQVFTEDAAVEQPAIALLRELGWQAYDAYHEFDAGASPVGRDSMGEVALLARLRPALQRLNPDLPAEALELGIQELTRDRSAMSPPAANREVYALLKHGVKVTYRPRDDGDECSESARRNREGHGQHPTRPAFVVYLRQSRLHAQAVRNRARLDAAEGDLRWMLWIRSRYRGSKN